MPIPTNATLIGGPYRTPKVRLGQIVTCLYRDCDVRLTSLHDAPIPWFRCSVPGVQGGTGLWVNSTLEQAIRTESAAALCYWFRISYRLVFRWRKTFGISMFGTLGSRRLNQASIEVANTKIRGQKLDLTEEQRQKRSRRVKRQWKQWRAQGRRCFRLDHRPWTEEEIGLIGTQSDKELAKRMKRTRSAIRAKRNEKGIAAYQEEESSRND